MNQKKPLKLFTIASIALLLLLLAAYLLRTALITSSANLFLAAADVRVLQLGELQVGWSELYLDQLVLGVGPNNTKQTLEDVRLGYSVFTLQPLFLQAGQVVLTVPQQIGDANGKEASVLLSELLDRLFTFPMQSLELGQLEVVGLSYPFLVQPMALSASVSEQRISVQGHDQNKTLLLDFKRTESNNTVVDATLSKDEKPIMHVELGLDKRQNMQFVTGEGELLVSEAFPLLKSVLPLQGVLSETKGQIFYQFSGEIDDNLAKREAAKGLFEIMPTSQLSAKFVAGEINTGVKLVLGSPVRVSLQPGSAQMLDFRLAVDSAGLQFKQEQTALLGEVDLSDLQCSFPGATQCSAELDVSMRTPHFDLPGDSAGAANDVQLNFSAKVSLSDNALKAQILASQWLCARSMLQNDLVLNDPSLVGGSGGYFEFDITSGALNFDAAELRLHVSQLEMPGLSLATVLQLQKLRLSVDEDGAFASSFQLSANTLDMKVPELWLPAVGFDSEVRVTDKHLDINASVLDNRHQPLVKIDAAYDFIQLQGRGRLYSDGLDFDAGEKRLSKHFSRWPFDWDVLAGSVEVDSSLRWHGLGPDMTLTADIEQSMEGIAGVYGDVGLVGLGADLSLQFQYPDHFLTTKIAKISVDSVDVGVPIEAIQAQLEFDSRDKTLSVDSAEAQLFGGRIWLEEMVYHADQAHNKLYVGVDGMQLDQLLQHAGYDAVQATGSVSGLLPLDVNNAGATMKRGMLAAKAPGGLFRYTAQVNADVSPTVAPVLAALQNYHYDVFQLEADYLDDGDLQLAMIFQGSNPQLQQGRPIHLNLNVTDNIPALLKSLRSGRKIAETVEKKLGGG